MELPGDVRYGDVLLRLSGNREALIENYKGILLYTSEEVAIACKKVTLRIYGCDLHIQYFSGSDMKVTGTINTISYLSNGDICC
ncbi:MAG: YabP/YqfC family sporulation protein [Bacteroidales bacterium]|nr:YabP/YqfC family sporulation protein [Clostridium sp.]MCM1204670.1 YabP/YqfC family sporulation protein [Bacteroidales bacterium]